jgi:GNAT superfamily N-acetyltransferase
MAHAIDEWGPDRAVALAALTDAALPGEELNEDELLACCWDDPSPAAGPASGDGGVGDAPGERGAVLGLADGTGAVSVVWRGPGAFRPGAYVKLVAVHPDARRQGRGHALLAAAEAWAWDQGAEALHLAGAPPFYLWPGVDVLATEALCLADARGYDEVGTGTNLTLPSGFRAPTPDGVEVRRAVHDPDVAAVAVLVGAHWPEWRDETARAVEHGCCHGAFTADGTAVGFVCHSVSRAGWLGPMGTDPARRGGGVGRSLLGAVARDLMIAEMPAVEICWAGPVRFYAANGATVSRVFRQYRLRRPPDSP